MSLRLFFSYSQKDEAFRKQLETHLSLLAGVIGSWSDPERGAHQDQQCPSGIKATAEDLKIL